MQHISTLDIPHSDLPLWMRRARQRVDWGLLLVIAFSLCLGWGFAQQAGISPYNTSINHAFRAADTADALREGRFYPRWSPHALGGYGAPIAHYYPPGASYAVALVEVLLTNDTLSALRLVYISTFALAAAAVYGMVGRWMGAGGGMIAALLYVFNPFVGFVAPQMLGDLPLVLGMTLTPVLLWAVNRLLMLNTAFDFAFISLTAGALLLTDPRLWWIGSILGVVLCGIHTITAPRGQKRRSLMVIAAMLVGIVMAAIYWLPAIGEYALVRWQPSASAAPTYALDLSTLFAPLTPLDPAEIAPDAQFTLGWVVRLFTLVGIVGMVLQPQHPQQRYPILFLLLGITLTAVTLGFTPTFVWMLGAVGLCFAVAGSAALTLEKRLPHRLQRLLLPLMLALILIGSINVWILPTRINAVNSLEPADQIRYEQQGLGVAVLPPGAAIPTTLSPDTDANLVLLNSYQFTLSQESEALPTLRDILNTTERCTLCPLEKIAPQQITRNGQINVIALETHRAEYQIRTLDDCRAAPNVRCPVEQPTVMTWQTSHFPGWEAWLNDLRLDLRRNPQSGLIDIRLPRTSGGALVIQLASTPVRDMSWVLSLCAFGILLIVIQDRLRHPDETYHEFALLSVEQTRLVGVVAVSFGVIFALTVPSPSPLHLRIPPNSGLSAISPLNVQTEVGLQLFGYRIADSRLRPGETLTFNLYWRAQRPLAQHYRVRVYLRDANRDTVWMAQPLRDPGGFPTRRWGINGYVNDQYRLLLPDTLFGGVYQIALEVYTCPDPVSCQTTDNTAGRQPERLTFYASDTSTAEKVFFLPTVLMISAE